MVFDVFLCLLITLAVAVPMIMVSDRYTPAEARLLRFGYVYQVVMVVVNMAVVKYVYRRGDMYAFYNDSEPVADWIRADPVLIIDLFYKMFGFRSSIGMAGSEGTHMMVGFATLARLFFGSSFPAMMLVPALIGFFAKVMLYDAFRDSFGRRHRRWVMLSFLFLPSTVFWTSGLIKETIALTSIGFLIWGAVKLFERRPWAIVPFLMGLAVLQQIKGHFLITMVVGGAAAFYVWRSSQGGRVQLRPVTFLLVLGLGFAGVLLVGEIAPRFALDNIAKEAIYLQSKSAGGSKIDIGVSRDMGLGGLVLLSPVAMFTGLYRPLIFESGSMTMIVNSFETTALAFLTLRGLRRTGLRNSLALAMRSPVFTFLVVFALLSSLGVGLATGNLGTLSRYRAPVIPFFALLLTVLDSRAVPATMSAPQTRKKKKKKRRRLPTTAAGIGRPVVKGK